MFLCEASITSFEFGGHIDDLPPGYLFLCPLANLQTEFPTRFRTRTCAACWSLDPWGTEWLSTEEARNLGFPNIELSVEVWGRRWNSSIYAGIRQFQEAKGFDSYSQDAALEAGYPPGVSKLKVGAQLELQLELQLAFQLAKSEVKLELENPSWMSSRAQELDLTSDWMPNLISNFASQLRLISGLPAVSRSQHQLSIHSFLTGCMARSKTPWGPSRQLPRKKKPTKCSSKKPEVVVDSSLMMKIPLLTPNLLSNPESLSANWSNWVKNPQWTHSLVAYLCAHLDVRRKLFSDSIAEAKKEKRKKDVAKEGKAVQHGVLAQAIFVDDPSKRARYVNDPTKYATSVETRLWRCVILISR
ncbi:hypothetical protein B0H14DRAFT_2642098 [Mycena olivaceomarginata]|nr:hypothetical protein B0H14DRAFT_2642098 [Mycena olivaceomarginata]